MIKPFVKQMELGPMQNYVYLLGDPETQEAAVIDPAWNVPAILSALQEEKYRLTHVILSHGHYDHMNGAEELIDKTGAVLCAQKSEIDFMEGGEGGLVLPRASLKSIVSADSMTLGRLEVRFIPTPGHTPGAQCIFVKDPSGVGGILFTGDILFVGTIGRCDFPYSNSKDLFQSLNKLKKLDDETVFYPGHDYGATPTNTLGREKQSNPYLLASSLEAFLSLVRH